MLRIVGYVDSREDAEEVKEIARNFVIGLRCKFLTKQVKK